MKIVSHSTWTRLGLVALLFAVAAGCSKDKPVAEPADAQPAMEAGRQELRDPSTQQDDGNEQTGSSGAMEDAAAIADLKPVYFAFDRANVKKSEVSKVRRAADLMAKYPKVEIRLEGHADERGSTDYNFVLGERRATSVRELLGGYGVDLSRVSTRSFGEEFPAVKGQNEAAWAKNRRVEFVIVNK